MRFKTGKNADRNKYVNTLKTLNLTHFPNEPTRSTQGSFTIDDVIFSRPYVVF